MQKIYLNKETHVVEQIIKEDYDHFDSYNNDTFGESFYMVIDADNIINGYNVRYNKELLQFEILPEVKSYEVKSYTESYVEPNETQIQIEELKKENKLLNEKFDKILILLQERTREKTSKTSEVI